jgi:hypothetical protein
MTHIVCQMSEGMQPDWDSNPGTSELVTLSEGMQPDWDSNLGTSELGLLLYKLSLSAAYTSSHFYTVTHVL